VKAAYALIVLTVLAGCGQHKTAPAPVSYATHGLTVELPPGWSHSTASLTPNLGDPREELAVATYPLRFRPHDCAHIPVSALEDLGPRDAFVELEERGVDPHSTWPDFPPRSDHFGPSLGTPSEAVDCVFPKARMSERSFGFTDQGRHFYARVAFGPDASDATRNDAWAILDSLKVDPGARPDWRAVP
jgi:hypothetical protein